MDTNDSRSKLIEAGQDVLEDIAPNHYILCPTRLIPLIAVRAKEYGCTTDMIEEVVHNAYRARGIDEYSPGTIMSDEVIREDDRRCTSKVLEAEAKSWTNLTW